MSICLKIQPISPREQYFQNQCEDNFKKLEQMTKNLLFNSKVFTNESDIEIIRSIVDLSQMLVDENRFLKEILNKNEISIELLTKDNYELSERLKEVLEDTSEIQIEKELYKQKVIYDDIINKLKTDISEYKLKLEINEEKKRTEEIEKEEINSRNEFLENKLQEEEKKCKTLKKLLTEKEREIRAFKKFNENVDKKFHSSKKDSSSNYSTVCSSFNITSYYTDISKGKSNFETCLSAICPELEEELGYTNTEIKITPVEIVRRMSKNDLISINLLEKFDRKNSMDKINDKRISVEKKR